MPLDGDDDIGMFCILLPQSLDRSMKSLQAWRLYEMGNECDGKKFKNKFELLNLRYPDRETGIIEIVKRNLSQDESVQTNTRKEHSKRMATTPASEVLPTIENEERVDGAHLGQFESTTQRPRDRNDSVATHRPRKRKRPHSAAAHEEVLSTTPVVFSNNLDPVLAEPSRRVPSRPEDTLSHPQHHIPEERVATTSNAPTITEQAKSPVSHEQLHDIHIVWTLDVDGSTYDLSVTMAECESFKGMMDKLHDVAAFIPSVPTILEKTHIWQMSYGLPDGRNKVHIARRDTEVAFDRMRAELAQFVREVGRTVEVRLRPWG
jgi:hypothetical protein